MAIDKDEILVIKRYFKGDFMGLIDACRPLKKFFKAKYFIVSLLPSIVLIGWLMYDQTKIDIQIKIIEELTSTGSSVVGVLLGISLGGFILVVSYGNQDLIDKSVRTQVIKYHEKEELKHSYIQVSIGKYGLIVLLQFVIFSMLLFGILCVNLEFKAHSNTARIINFLAIGIYSFMLFYAVLLTYQLILNIFTLSQSSSYNLFLTELDNYDNSIDSSDVEQQSDKQY